MEGHRDPAHDAAMRRISTFWLGNGGRRGPPDRPPSPRRPGHGRLQQAAAGHCPPSGARALSPLTGLFGSDTTPSGTESKFRCRMTASRRGEPIPVLRPSAERRRRSRSAELHLPERLAERAAHLALPRIAARPRTCPPGQKRFRTMFLLELTPLTVYVSVPLSASEKRRLTVPASMTCTRPGSKAGPAGGPVVR